MIGEFCKNCQGLVAEAFEPIFVDIWVYIKDILLQYSSLEKLCESSTRLLKHNLRIVPQVFKQNYLVEFLQIVIS